MLDGKKDEEKLVFSQNNMLMKQEKTKTHPFIQ
jgi:hypothetical protein